MNASDKRAAGTARRRRVAVAGLLAVAMGAAVAFTGAQALATGGLGRCQHVHGSRPGVAIGSDWDAQDRDSHEDRAGPMKGKASPGRQSFTYQTVTLMMTCGTSTACDTAYQQLTIPPGGFTGWHTHPGPMFVAVAQGEGTLYHGMSGCPSVKYATGAGSAQPSTEVHNMRNEGSAPLVLWAFYALPPGTTNAAIRIDQPQPAECPNIP